ncbi:hypothetical protein FVE85_1296 [Porphyridium purpureum]|uniref:Uncharacterized protein n=1 Tax=Porphyridium purpureum TaxID=35688 RepID=A0A5J4YHF5_PORPP|nr:hypothetical protein FVE85_1296 [Porphyridium purpureum]|eukprot:POR6221..scf251_18
MSRARRKILVDAGPPSDGEQDTEDDSSAGFIVADDEDEESASSPRGEEENAESSGRSESEQDDASCDRSPLHPPPEHLYCSLCDAYRHVDNFSAKQQAAGAVKRRARSSSTVDMMPIDGRYCLKHTWAGREPVLPPPDGSGKIRRLAEKVRKGKVIQDDAGNETGSSSTRSSSSSAGARSNSGSASGRSSGKSHDSHTETDNESPNRSLGAKPPSSAQKHLAFESLSQQLATRKQKSVTVNDTSSSSSEPRAPDVERKLRFLEKRGMDDQRGDIKGQQTRVASKKRRLVRVEEDDDE